MVTAVHVLDYGAVITAKDINKISCRSCVVVAISMRHIFNISTILL